MWRISRRRRFAANTFSERKDSFLSSSSPATQSDSLFICSTKPPPLRPTGMQPAFFSSDGSLSAFSGPSCNTTAAVYLQYVTEQSTKAFLFKIIKARQSRIGFNCDCCFLETPCQRNYAKKKTAEVSDMQNEEETTFAAEFSPRLGTHTRHLSPDFFPAKE